LEERYKVLEAMKWSALRYVSVSSQYRYGGANGGDFWADKENIPKMKEHGEDSWDVAEVGYDQAISRHTKVAWADVYGRIFIDTSIYNRRTTIVVSNLGDVGMSALVFLKAQPMRYLPNWTWTNTAIFSTFGDFVEAENQYFLFGTSMMLTNGQAETFPSFGTVAEKTPWPGVDPTSGENVTYGYEASLIAVARWDFQYATNCYW